MPAPVRVEVNRLTFVFNNGYDDLVCKSDVGVMRKVYRMI